MILDKIKFLKVNFVKKLIIILISFLAIFIFTNSVEAALTCSVTSGSCSGTTVFKMQSTSNSHAELPSQTNYNYYVCCSGVTDLGNDCNATNKAVALKLSAATNAHVEKNTYTNYTNSVCLSAPSGPSITCSYASNCSTLGSDYVCLASISGDTNAHVGNCDAYSTKVCCAVSIVPDFFLSALPTTIKAPQIGTSQSSTITITSTNNFNSAVTLSVSAGLPTGATANFTPNPVTPPANGTTTSTLTITTSNVSAGSYTLTIQGQGGSPLLTRTTDITLTVVDLSVVLSAVPSSGPPPLNDVDLTATVSGSAIGTINYKFDCTNDGSWDYTFDNITDNPKTVLDACDYTSEGTYTAKVRVERDVANPAEDTVDIVVSSGPLPFEFSILINPTSGSVTQGSQVAATVQITKTQGTAENVTFWATNLPTGVTYNFSPTNCTPNNTCNSTVTFSAASGASLVNNWSINVGGTADGGFANWTIYQLTVTEGGVAIVPPVVTTNPATNITQTSATLNGTLNNIGGASTCLVWFKWKLSTATTWNETTPISMTATGPFSAVISGLTAGQTYYFEAFAKNGGSW
jgi:hypothetical protein